MPFVSVIILSWNGKHFLKDCLDSLNKQSFRDFEVILVDNGSADGSIGFVEEAYPWVKVIVNDKNYGFAKGNNIGIKEAKGKYIVTLNNDMVFDKNLLKELCAAAERNKDAGSIAAKIYFMDKPKTLNSVGLKVLPDGVSIDQGFNEKDEGQYDKLRHIFGPTAGAALYKMEMLEDVKLFGQYFDESYFLYAEDVDLAWRAQLRGWKSVFAPKAIVYHKYRGTSSNLIEKADNFFCLRNYYFNLVKNFSLLDLLKRSPKIVRRILITFVAPFRYKSFTPVKAMLSFLFNLPYILLKRLVIQSKRRIPSHKVGVSILISL